MNHHGIHKKSCEFMGRWTIHPVDSLQLDRWIHLHLELHAASNLHNFGWEAGAVSSRVVADRNQPLQREQKLAKMVTKLSKSLSALQVVMMANQFMFLCWMCLTQKGHADVTGSWIGWVQLFHFLPCTWHHESLSSLTGKSSFYSSNASRVFVTMHFY